MHDLRHGKESLVTVSLQVPALLEYRDLASRAVATVCRHALTCSPGMRAGDASAEFINELISAVGEAFNNVVAHAYGNSGDGTIDMELGWNHERVAVKIWDFGRPFDLETVPRIDLSMPHENGMGVHIIRSFVDVVVYQAGSPNLLMLTKYIPQKAA